MPNSESSTSTGSTTASWLDYLVASPYLALALTSGSSFYPPSPRRSFFPACPSRPQRASSVAHFPSASAHEDEGVRENFFPVVFDELVDALCFLIVFASVNLAIEAEHGEHKGLAVALHRFALQDVSHPAAGVLAAIFEDEHHLPKPELQLALAVIIGTDVSRLQTALKRCANSVLCKVHIFGASHDVVAHLLCSAPTTTLVAFPVALDFRVLVLHDRSDNNESLQG
eukprot:CAMPEP_0195036036 /NCGR_PEP_ID=MMETSP0326_2-20130528/71595_1 /TAXON_ID=2866 ORGANISM="Crypthecodinium cohnii, Strain Seligo" /NCGR_SAMPLE_ID=MMETSP0326_2 /ASSEMBLY_ACC=CAM_ASM_000348 /LENGTH=226 /DNA_ID=CAMNT_0040061475 /DNA_START=139 /DNA_END=820 /DNA_ORIENTATION=+